MEKEYKGLTKDGIANLLLHMTEDIDDMFEYFESSSTERSSMKIPWTLNESTNWMNLSQGLFDLQLYISHLERQLESLNK